MHLAASDIGEDVRIPPEVVAERGIDPSPPTFGNLEFEPHIEH